MIAAALLPIAIVVLLLASRRATLVQAGLAGLVGAAASIAVARPVSTPMPRFLAEEALRGAWIAWQAVAVVLASLFLFQVLRPPPGAAGAEVPPASPGHPASPDPPASRATAPATGSRRVLGHRAAFFACFLLGPFIESATGFGVGVLVTAHALLRAGAPRASVVPLALYSQLLVPWGALAIGIDLAEAFSGVPLARIGALSALVALPVLFLALMPFWALARRSGARVTARGQAEDAGWVALVGALLLGANRAGAVDVAGLAAAGAGLVGHWALHGARDRAARRAAMAAALPYAALTAVLLVTRLVPGVGGPLRAALTVAPFAGGPAFAPLYHPSTVILAVALAMLPLRVGPRRGAGDMLRDAARAVRAPALATLTFVVLAHLLGASGLTRALGVGLEAALGRAAPLATPALAAFGGALTGSNVASNAMVLPLQLAIAASRGVSLELIAGIHNAIGSGFTLFSPSRVALGLAAVGERDERGAYRGAAPLALILLAVGLACAAAAMAWGGTSSPALRSP